MLGKAMAWCTTVAVVLAGATMPVYAAPATEPLPDPTASTAARAVARHVLEQQDAQGRPFAIVDKLQARLYVFTADGRLAGSTAALLGLARGDDSVPGVGAKAASFIPPAERTTPAGRFISMPGRNLKGEAIVWLDYTAAVAIHRLRPADPAERRPQRLDSVSPDDNRISLGCVVVSAAFYDAVVAPLLGRAPAVVYVLPETRGWQTLFSAPAGAAEAF